MSWDYAELSKLAKQNGGPEKLVNLIAKDGFNKGRASTAPWIGVAAAGASAITIATMKIVESLKKKKEISPEALEEAKKELIQGIKEYDATHPDGETEDAE